jgi:hypothetical protein
VIIDDNPNDLIMEVRRFLYNGQNQKKNVWFLADSGAEDYKLINDLVYRNGANYD